MNQGHLTSTVLTQCHTTDCMLSEINLDPELAVIQQQLATENKTIYTRHSQRYGKNLYNIQQLVF